MIENLKSFTFEITDFNSDLSKITIGGVDLSNVDSKTMESTLISNLYFAGKFWKQYNFTIIWKKKSRGKVAKEFGKFFLKNQHDLWYRCRLHSVANHIAHNEWGKPVFVGWKPCVTFCVILCLIFVFCIKCIKIFCWFYFSNARSFYFFIA